MVPGKSENFPTGSWMVALDKRKSNGPSGKCAPGGDSSICRVVPPPFFHGVGRYEVEERCVRRMAGDGGERSDEAEVEEEGGEGVDGRIGVGPIVEEDEAANVRGVP